MGSGNSSINPLPESGIVQTMRQKYGNECVECLNEWTNSYGFPKGGSLSTKEVKKLKGKLREAEDKLKK